MFGTLEDMTELIKKAKEKGIQIIMDLVVNHSSDEHPWFLEAKKSRNNEFHDYYIWVDGEEGTLPNRLKSCFGGSAWEWVPELRQYYLHLFSVRQPDLNWENPKLREDIINMINWWTEKGVSGFRLDVIDLIGKEPLKEITNNGLLLHEYIQEMNRKAFQGKDLLTVGETWGATPEIAKKYSNSDESEFSMVFQFEHISLDQQEGKSKWDLAPLDFIKLKQVLSKWQIELKDNGWNSLFWNNHDLPRIVSRWGDDSRYRELSAKMLATIIHCMKGTPYIYQGEELGMTNVRYDISEYRDIELLGFYKERIAQGYNQQEVMRSIYAKGRDNARTPMQWNDSVNSGFSSGKPWIKVNPNYVQINAEEQLDRPDSIFNYYKRLIDLRKQYDVISYGDYELLMPDDKQIFAYIRTYGDTKIRVICNFTKELAKHSILQEGDYELLLSNYPDKGNETYLRAYEVRIELKTII